MCSGLGLLVPLLTRLLVTTIQLLGKEEEIFVLPIWSRHPHISDRRENKRAGLGICRNILFTLSKVYRDLKHEQWLLYDTFPTSK